MDTRLNYESEFLKGVNIFVVFSEDPSYGELKTMFDEYGYGFMVPNKNMIVIDGEILLQNLLQKTYYDRHGIEFDEKRVEMLKKHF